MTIFWFDIIVYFSLSIGVFIATANDLNKNIHDISI